jgi:hypothetical protein
VEFLAMIDKYRAGVVTFELFVEFSAGKEEAMAMARREHATAQVQT